MDQNPLYHNLFKKLFQEEKKKPINIELSARKKSNGRNNI
jgi:hypothetical protein